MGDIQRRAHRTWSRYRAALELFVAYTDDRGVSAIDRFVIRDVEGFAARLRGKNRIRIGCMGNEPLATGRRRTCAQSVFWHGYDRAASLRRLARFAGYNDKRCCAGTTPTTRTKEQTGPTPKSGSSGSALRRLPTFAARTPRLPGVYVSDVYVPDVYGSSAPIAPMPQAPSRPSHR